MIPGKDVQTLPDRVRQQLRANAREGEPITYQALAQRLELNPPHTIQQLATALETLMEQDARLNHPMIAALVVSKAIGGLPRQGFFECAKRVGRFDGDAFGLEAAQFHKTEFESAVEFWSTFS